MRGKDGATFAEEVVAKEGKARPVGQREDGKIGMDGEHITRQTSASTFFGDGGRSLGCREGRR